MSILHLRRAGVASARATSPVALDRREAGPQRAVAASARLHEDHNRQVDSGWPEPPARQRGEKHDARKEHQPAPEYGRWLVLSLIQRMHTSLSRLVNVTGISRRRLCYILHPKPGRPSGLRWDEQVLLEAMWHEVKR